ncbi:hypothetical protein EV681_4546 [Advenella incenata]|uniref:Uncharacterized protein n=1 Tax=Advenella incenata TaxID=267800 RepID=A0A4Q7V948_9BURK|nr:hypothetical protein [Advenella incenata]RZT91192.1 hypothetical protein EV681_4546 [Advenella incenata]
MRQDDLKEAKDMSDGNIDQAAEGSVMGLVFWCVVIYALYQYFF